MSNQDTCIPLQAYATVIAGLDAGLDLGRAVAHAGVAPSIWEKASAEWQARIDESAASDLAVLVAFDAALIAEKRRFGPVHEPIASDVRAWTQFRRHFLMAADPPAFLAEHDLTLSTYAHLELQWAHRALAEEALAREIQQHMAAPLDACPKIVVTPSPLLRLEAHPWAAKVSPIAPPPPPPAPVAPPPPPAPVALPPPPQIQAAATLHVAPQERAREVAKGWLPFQSSGAAHGPHGAAARPAPPQAGTPTGRTGAAPPEETLDTTVEPAPSPIKPALPFQQPPKERGAPMQAAPVAGSTTAGAPPAPAAHPRPAVASPAAPAIELTLEQYASMCAELSVFQDRAEAVFAKYGLSDARRRAAVDAAWKERLLRYPAERAEWERRYWQYESSWRRARR